MANTFSLDLELSSSQYAFVADTAPLSVTGDLTIEAWIKLEQLPTTVGATFIIACKFDAVPLRSYFFAVNSSDNKLIFGVSADGTNIPTAISTTALTTGVWYHTAVTYNASAGTCAFYLDGSSDGTGSSLNTSINDNASRFAIGANNTASTPIQFFDGLVDEVRVWNDIRTAQEISDNYLTELAGNESGLVGYWKLNNDYTDSTANAATLTASGSPVFSTDVPFVGAGISGIQSKYW